MGNPIYQVGNVTALMEATDSSNRGTILASRFALTQLALIVGASTGGLISAVIGPEATYGILGAGLVSLAVLAWLLQRGERSAVAEATP
jgi:predicted MFS family arabinose efflux permease